MCFTDTFASIGTQLASALKAVLKMLRAAFPPLAEAPGHEARREAVHSALAWAAEDIIEFLTRIVNGCNKTTLRDMVSAVCAALETSVVAIADFIELHPKLSQTLVRGSVMLLLFYLNPGLAPFYPLTWLFNLMYLGPAIGSFKRHVQHHSWFVALQHANTAGIRWLTRMIDAGLGYLRQWFGAY
ncbi:hypothetical protein K488DRAFT_86954 [Vararia minispora EC-137]|uniref:Uncharacterized protein n=1 Tax=Vararia minispora EC-137 TaxID=1314806 RepID=A0ACB8QI58_9AGAM|nr:hypothetical protein K488DRAFT_86954 [Vararia minispora EC-137]